MASVIFLTSPDAASPPAAGVSVFAASCVAAGVDVVSPPQAVREAAAMERHINAAANFFFIVLSPFSLTRYFDLFRMFNILK